MKLNKPQKINGDQKECQVGTSCGYLFSVTLSVLTDSTDAASQEQGIQKTPSPTWETWKSPFLSSESFSLPTPLSSSTKEEKSLFSSSFVLMPIEPSSDKCYEYWCIHDWKYTGAYSLLESWVKSNSMPLCLESTGILNAIRFECHQLTCKKECFHTYKNGEESTKLKSENLLISTTYQIFYHLPATVLGAKTTILNKIDTGSAFIELTA